MGEAVGTRRRAFRLYAETAPAIARLTRAGHKVMLLPGEAATDEAALAALAAAGACVEPLSRDDPVMTRRVLGAGDGVPWVVGGRAKDIAAGLGAALRTILVETGPAGRDGGPGLIPHYVLPDLAAAAAFILDGHPALLAQAARVTAGLGPRSLLLIGGDARSGKTTFAQACVESLAARGQSAVLLSADRWLHSAERRQATVLGRYDMAALRALLAGVMARSGPLDLAIPYYEKFVRLCLPDAERILIPADAVVVVEGTIAMALADVAPDHPRLSVAIHVDESVRHARFRHEYHLRGGSDAEVEGLYQSRLEDERPIVEALCAKADMAIELPPTPNGAGGMPS